MNEKRIQAGLWIRTQWEDCGAIDGIIVEPETASEGVRIFLPAEGTFRTAEVAQIVAIGKPVSYTDTGLNG